MNMTQWYLVHLNSGRMLLAPEETVKELEQQVFTSEPFAEEWQLLGEKDE